jgi:GNAT superfamily N-acetyltransferase
MLASTAELSADEIHEIVVLVQDCADIEFAPMLAVRVQSLLDNSYPMVKVVRMRIDGRLAGIGLINTAGLTIPGCIIAVAQEYRRRGLGSEILQSFKNVVPVGSIRVWNYADRTSGLEFAQRHEMIIHQRLHFMEVVNSLSTFASLLATRNEYKIRVVDPLNLPTNWSRIIDGSYLTPTVAAELVTRPWWPKSKIVVAESDEDSCIGLLVLRDVKYRGVKSIENHLMAVHSNWRGLGIGRALTTASLVFARETNCGYSISYVDRSNIAAVQAHLNSGFLIVSSDSVFRYSW